MIQRDTHDALVTEGTAETFLANAENASRKDERAPRSDYLLTGLLRTPGGGPWHGNRVKGAAYYRAKADGRTRSLRADQIDEAVLATVSGDLSSDAFIARAVKTTREKFAVTHDDDIAGARKEIDKLEAQIAKLLDMASQLKSPAPVLLKVDALEDARTLIEQRIVGWEREDETAKAVAGVTDAQVRKMPSTMVQEVALYEPAEMRDFLSSVLSSRRFSIASKPIRTARRCNSSTGSW